MTYDALKVHIEYIREALERGEKRMARIEGRIGALPCSKPGACPTQQLDLPDAQAARDQALGGAVRRTWHAIPHVYRCVIGIVSCCTVSGGLGGCIVAAWPHIKNTLAAVLLST